MPFSEFLATYEKEPTECYPHKVCETPLVSVCIQTYQHVSYIRQCLDSILMQQTDFPFEVLLGEDASTDGTREVCIEYANLYPNKIRLFLHHRANNIYIGGQPTGRFNFLYNIHSARGKYIALCEGDDYWTDSLKLQKQVDFLEHHKEYNLCFHKVQRIQKGKDEYVVKDVPTCYYDGKFIDLIRTYNFISTPSMVFRNNIEIPNWFSKLPFGDLGIVFLLSRKGKMQAMNDVMAVYRLHNEGLWSGKNFEEQKKSLLRFNKTLFPHLSEGEKAEVLFKNTDIIEELSQKKYPNSVFLQKLYSKFMVWAM